jgi:hypothetical protein
MDVLLILLKTFPEKSVQMLSYQIESDGKIRFLPLYHFGRYLYFTYVDTFSKKSRQTISDRIESSGKNHFLLFSFSEGNLKKGITIIKIKGSQRSVYIGICTNVL